MLEYIAAAVKRLASRVGRWSGIDATAGFKRADSPDISGRIRARYDTARKLPEQRPTRQWLREHGVLDDWNDIWRAQR